MTKGLKSASGTENNPVMIGETNRLFGDPSIQLEKPYTIILGPGFDVEIARCVDGSYWVHLGTKQVTPNDPRARIMQCRLDSPERYVPGAVHDAVDAELGRGIDHIAFRVVPVT